MVIVGFKAGWHDPSVVFLVNGNVAFAAEEERFTRVKHAGGSLPINSFKAGLSYLGISISDINYWSIHHAHPLLLMVRTIFPNLAKPPRNLLELRFSVIQVRDIIRFFISWLKGNLPYQLFFKELSIKKPNKFFVEHHIGHGLSSTLFCKIEKGISLSMDGQGDGTSIMVSKFNNTKSNILFRKKTSYFKVMKRYDPRYSLGFGYTEFTKYLGFEPNDAEYKVMGLASYGKPQHDMLSIFGFENGVPKRKVSSYIYWSKKSKDLNLFFRREPRAPESEWDQTYADIAASVQTELESTVLKFSRKELSRFKESNLVFSGGVALNVKMNKVVRENLNLKNFFVQPVSSDAGLALGGAAHVYRKVTGKLPEHLNSLHLGPDVKDFELPSISENEKLSVTTYTNYEELCDWLAHKIASGAVVAWMQGRMEFGPRALGARSILADPRLEVNKDRVNAKIKFRELFRPFCPSMLKSDFIKYIEPNTNWQASKSLNFMVEAFQASSKAKDEIPAVIHIDGSMRPQVLEENENNLSIAPYLTLLKAFKKQTGIGVLLNTSLNRRGEPIACYPAEGYDIFLNTDLDILVIDKNIIQKKS